MITNLCGIIFIIFIQWLETEALPGNPKIERTLDGKYMFKPPYKLKDRKALLKLLKQQDLKGLGGIMMDDIQESLPNCEKALKVKIYIVFTVIVGTCVYNKIEYYYLYSIYKTKYYMYVGLETKKK